MQIMLDLNDALESSRKAEVAITMLRTAADLLENSSIVQSARASNQPQTAKHGSDPKPEAPAPKIESVVLPFAKPTEAPSAPAQTETSAPKLLDAPPPPPSSVVIPDPPKAAPTVTGQASTAGTTANVAPTSTGASSVTEYDSAGVPWDARIHQKAKSKKKDLTWKIQKGLDPLIVQGVIAELSANGKLRQADAFPPKAAEAPSPPSSAAASVFGKTPLPAGAEAPQPPAPPVNNAPPPPPPSDAQPGTAFRTLVARFAAATKAGHMTPQQLNALCQANGAPNIMALNSMEHLIPAVNTALDGELLSRGVTL
jgi:hypothetical protein